MRVQIPAHTDRWMMGDRYGEVTKRKMMVFATCGTTVPREALRVKLDKSKKSRWFWLSECEIVTP